MQKDLKKKKKKHSVEKNENVTRLCSVHQIDFERSRTPFRGIYKVKEDVEEGIMANISKLLSYKKSKLLQYCRTHFY